MPVDGETAGPTPADALRIGVVVDNLAQVATMSSPLWLRGDAARRARESVASARRAHPALQDISADANDVVTLEALRSIDVVPVLGPATLERLLDLLRRCDRNAVVYLPASPGRTEAEARARLARDPEIEAEAATAGALIGTLEQCQETVGILQAAGASELRLRLPSTADLADVIAQMSVLGDHSLARVQPGTPRSRAPNAPTGWGGRT
jgi:hypothetical protein